MPRSIERPARFSKREGGTDTDADDDEVGIESGPPLNVTLLPLTDATV